MTLRKEQIQRMREVLGYGPTYRDRIIDTWRSMGLSEVEIESVFEDLPVDWRVEAREFGKGIKSGLTLGISDVGPPDLRAGDIEILGQSISPSRAAGDIVGTVPYAMAGIGTAKKLFPIAKMAGSGSLPLRVGRKATEHMVGSAVPGAVSGYALSDGSIDEAMKTASMWVAAGLIGEGVFRALGSGLKKLQRNKSTNEDGTLALKETEVEALNEYQSLSRLVSGGEGEESGRVVKYLDTDSQKRIGAGGGHRLGAGGRSTDSGSWLSDSQREIAQAMEEGVPPEFIYYDSQLRTGDVGSGWVYGPTSPSRQGVHIETSTGMLGGKAEPRTNLGTRGMGGEERYKGDLTRGPNIVTEVEERLDVKPARYPSPGTGKASTAPIGYFGAKSKRQVDVGAESPLSNSKSKVTKADRNLDDQPVIAQEAIDRITVGSEISLELRSGAYLPDGLAGKRSFIEGDLVSRSPGILELNDPKLGKVFAIHVDDVTSVKIKNRTTSRTGKHVREAAAKEEKRRTYGRRPRTVHPISGGSDAYRKIKDTFEDTTPLTKGQYKEIQLLEVKAREVGYKSKIPMSKISSLSAGKAREHIEDLTLNIHRYDSQRINKSIEDNLKYSVDPRYGDKYEAFPETGGVGRFVPDEELFREPSLPWLTKFLSPMSRWGISANPAIRQITHGAVFMFDQMGKRSRETLEKYKELLQTIAPQKQELTEQIPIMLQKDKVLLLRALDGKRGLTVQETAEEIIRDNPHLREAYFGLRSLINTQAREVGLPPDRPLSTYVQDLSNGRLGTYGLHSITRDEMGDAARFLRRHERTHKDAFESFLKNLAHRGEGEAFAYDLDGAMYTFARMTARHNPMAEFAESAIGLYSRLPDVTKSGKPLATKEAFGKYIETVLGKPTPTRVKVARFFQDNDAFNRGMDSLIEFIGDSESKGLLRAAREAEAWQHNGVPVGGAAGERARKLNIFANKYFEKLVQDASKWTTKGEVKPTRHMDRYRAELAIKVAQLRSSITDPNTTAPIVSSLYRLMVFNKLALNVSHGIVNMTQVLTNTTPLVGMRYTVKGVQDYLSAGKTVFHNGRNAKQIIKEAGIHDASGGHELVEDGVGMMYDTNKLFPLGGGSGEGKVLARLEDMAMSPTRLSEEFNRGVTLLAKYRKGIEVENLTHSQALAAAGELVSRTQFVFNAAGTIPFMRGPFWKLMFMFKSYGIHQMNFSAELLEDALKGRGMGPFARHVMAYLGMFGAGSTVLGFTALGDRTQHPAMDFTPANQERWDGLLMNLGGPPAASLIEILSGQTERGMKQWYSPTFAKRTERALKTQEGTGESLLQLMGLSPTTSVSAGPTDGQTEMQEYRQPQLPPFGPRAVQSSR